MNQPRQTVRLRKTTKCHGDILRNFVTGFFEPRGSSVVNDFYSELSCTSEGNNRKDGNYGAICPPASRGNLSPPTYLQALGKIQCDLLGVQSMEDLPVKLKPLTRIASYVRCNRALPRARVATLREREISLNRRGYTPKGDIVRTNIPKLVMTG